MQRLLTSVVHTGPYAAPQSSAASPCEHLTLALSRALGFPFPTLPSPPPYLPRPPCAAPLVQVPARLAP